MIFLLQQNVNQNGDTIELYEILFVNFCLRKLNKLPRALRKEISKKKFKNKLKEEMQKNTRTDSRGQKLKALKVYFIKIIHESPKRKVII